MTGELHCTNRQRGKRINARYFRRALLFVLGEMKLEGWGVHFIFVSAKKMAEINMQFLGHEGSTDVITFPLLEKTDPKRATGEIFISVEDAVKNAGFFDTSWQEEVFRYAIHGLLHLVGFDDLTTSERRLMKREEGVLLRKMCRTFPPAGIESDHYG